MLSTGPTEAAERIFGQVITTLGRNLLNCVRHVLDGDIEEAFCALVFRFVSSGGRVHLRRHLFEQLM
ncbi:hypothetical protein D9M70_448630 [compost metagenome]